MYKIVFHNRARKKLNKIPLLQANKIEKEIDLLLNNPFDNKNHDIKKVKNKPLTFRCRVGEYRIIYIINREKKVINIRRIENREWDYKTLYSFLQF